MSDHNPPRPYDLDDPAELLRLYQEVAGYLRICESCGTDHSGRRYARQAMDELVKRMDGGRA